MQEEHQQSHWKFTLVQIMTTYSNLCVYIVQKNWQKRRLQGLILQRDNHNSSDTDRSIWKQVCMTTVETAVDMWQIFQWLRSCNRIICGIMSQTCTKDERNWRMSLLYQASSHDEVWVKKIRRMTQIKRITKLLFKQSISLQEE